jgi:hypothetical protein
MKKMFLLFLCMSIMYSSIAQQTPSGTSKPVLTKEEYLQRSKKLWRVAIIVVSAGGAMAIAGIALGTNGNNYNDDGNLSGALFITGCAVMISSLGFSIPAHINKKKAMSVSFKNEFAPLMQRNMVFNRSVPSLSLKIRL